MSGRRLRRGEYVGSSKFLSPGQADRQAGRRAAAGVLLARSRSMVYVAGMSGHPRFVGRDGLRPPNSTARLFRLAVVISACVWAAAGGVRPAVAGDRFVVGGFWFAAPPGWIRLAVSSAMRKARFRVPNPGAGYDGMVVFYQFGPGMGGSAERNIARWTSQFKETGEALGAAVETRRGAGRRLHYFRATGTLIGRDGEMPGYTPHAALLEGSAGRAFIRFVAPKGLAGANAATFRALIDGAFGDRSR